MTEVSIIISVYNVEKYLKKCLDSVVNQTLRDIKIICVNDGSTDGSADILNEYASKDPRIKIINQKNKGASFACQAGIDSVETPYLGFVDADDWVEPETFETALKTMKKYDVDFVCWLPNIIAEYEHPEIQEVKDYFNIDFKGYYDDLSVEMKFRTPVTTWSKLYKTEIIKKHGNRYESGSRHEDDVFWFKYLPWVKTGFFLDKRFYNYVQRENSIMCERRTAKKPKICQSIINIPIIVNYYQKHGIYEDYAQRLFDYFINYINIDYYNAHEDDKKKVLKIIHEVFSKTNFGSFDNHYYVKAIRDKKFYKIESLHIENKYLDLKFLKIWKEKKRLHVNLLFLRMSYNFTCKK